MSDIEWTPDERTVRAALEVYDFMTDLKPGHVRTILGTDEICRIRKGIESLIPKPDPDVELVARVITAFLGGYRPHVGEEVFKRALRTYKANKP